MFPISLRAVGEAAFGDQPQIPLWELRKVTESHIQKDPKETEPSISYILGIRSWEEMALNFIGLPHWGDSHLSQIASNSFPLKYSSASSRGHWFLNYAWDSDDL